MDEEVLLSIIYFTAFASTVVCDWLYYGETLKYVLQTDIFMMQNAKEIYLGNVSLLGLLSVVDSILAIAYLIIDVFAVFAFFRFYAKKNHNMYSFLAVFIEPLFPIFVFAFRKNKRFDYNQYMKMHFDSYTGKGSQGGYNNPQQPYTKKPEEKDGFPFEDYNQDSEPNGGNEDVFAEYSSNNDNYKAENDNFGNKTAPNDAETKETDDGDLF